MKDSFGEILERFSNNVLKLVQNVQDDDPTGFNDFTKWYQNLSPEDHKIIDNLKAKRFGALTLKDTLDQISEAKMSLGGDNSVSQFLQIHTNIDNILKDNQSLYKLYPQQETKQKPSFK